MCANAVTLGDMDKIDHKQEVKHAHMSCNARHIIWRDDWSRFTSEVGYRMAKILIVLYEENIFYEQWHLNP